MYTTNNSAWMHLGLQCSRIWLLFNHSGTHDHSFSYLLPLNKFLTPWKNQEFKQEVIPEFQWVMIHYVGYWYFVFDSHSSHFNGSFASVPNSFANKQTQSFAIFHPYLFKAQTQRDSETNRQKKPIHLKLTKSLLWRISLQFCWLTLPPPTLKDFTFVLLTESIPQVHTYRTLCLPWQHWKLTTDSSFFARPKVALLLLA